MKSSILFTLLFCPLLIVGQVWDYPVKPGTEEWKKFNSNEEMVDACQIPEDVLTSLSTDDLTELCLQYPLLYDIFAFDNLNNGLDKLFSDFNGVRELSKRKDVFERLLERYKYKIQNLSFLEGEVSDVEKGLFIISVSALEVLLSRFDIQDDAAEGISREVLQNLVFGYERKSIFVDYFKGFGFRTNFYSRIHVISKINKQSLEKLPQEAINTVLFSGAVDVQSMNIIDELSYQLIK